MSKRQWKFKVGQRVRYIGTMREHCGEIAYIEKLGTGMNEDRYQLANSELRCCMEESLTLVSPASPFEESLIAYIAKEKKELGLA